MSEEWAQREAHTWREGLGADTARDVGELSKKLDKALMPEYQTLKEHMIAFSEEKIAAFNEAHPELGPDESSIQRPLKISNDALFSSAYRQLLDHIASKGLTPEGAPAIDERKDQEKNLHSLTGILKELKKADKTYGADSMQASELRNGLMELVQRNMEEMVTEPGLRAEMAGAARG